MSTRRNGCELNLYQFERGAEVLTVIAVGVLFFVGGSLIGLSVAVLVAILVITAVATVAVFVLS